MKDKKILYFDVETTGRNWMANDIVQLGIIIEINGEVVEEREITTQPFDWDSVEQEALDITGMTIEQLKSFQEPREAYLEVVELLGKYVDKFDKQDKFYPAGYNVDFDLNFLQSFFKKNNDKYFGSWVNWKKLDPLPLLFLRDFEGAIELENYKLGTVAAHFGIEIEAHDAVSDVRATRLLLLKLMEGGDLKNPK